MLLYGGGCFRALATVLPEQVSWLAFRSYSIALPALHLSQRKACPVKCARHNAIDMCACRLLLQVVALQEQVSNLLTAQNDSTSDQLREALDREAAMKTRLDQVGTRNDPLVVVSDCQHLYRTLQHACWCAGGSQDQGPFAGLYLNLSFDFFCL